jgi:preprotein translocase subunit SecF
MKTIKLVPEETNIDFIGKRFIAFIFSALIILGSIGLSATKGLNFGIDFTGGTMIEIRLDNAPDLVNMRALLNGLDLGAISIQEFGEDTDILIRLPQQEGGKEAQQEAVNKIRASLDVEYGENKIDYRRTEYVGPQVGEELKKAGALAILFSLAGILIYIWFRFEWQFGIAAIIALAHDTAAIIGLFALTQMEFNLSTVAAILMIAGYSINDTVVVFDRIRENLRKYKKKPLEELFNLSINQMLARTLMTSVTTLLALFALWVFGGEVIRGFIDALIFGILIGTYSSIFVASPVLLFMNLRGASAEPTPEPSKA